jgi:hypothetical protein
LLYLVCNTLKHTVVQNLIVWMKKSAIFIGLVLFTRLLNAQSDFRPGYIINNNDDTISGQIDYRGDLIMKNTCRFKEPGSSIIDYTPNDIKAFRFIDSKYYVVKEIQGRKVFLEYLIKGKINIYYLYSDNAEHYYIDKENEQMEEIPYDEGTTTVDGKLVYYETKTHIGLLVYYMMDAPQLQQDISTMGKPSRDNLIRLAKEYQSATCKDADCIVYEKKLPAIKLLFEPFAGVIKVRDGDSPSMYYGCNVHFWAPRTNERLYFKTGLSFFRVPVGDKKTDIVKIPLQLEYLFPGKTIRPKAGLGFDIWSRYVETTEDYQVYDNKEVTYFFNLNAGLNVRINDNINLSLTGNSDMSPLYLMLLKSSESRIFSYYFDMGIWVSF